MLQIPADDDEMTAIVHQRELDFYATAKTNFGLEGSKFKLAGFYGGEPVGREEREARVA